MAFQISLEQVQTTLIALWADHLGQSAKDFTIDSKVSDPKDGTDAMDLLEIALDAEEHFRVEIPDASLEKIETLGQLAGIIHGLNPT